MYIRVERQVVIAKERIEMRRHETERALKTRMTRQRLDK
jgi:hypothetical protein